jgi:hypothetical protein
MKKINKQPLISRSLFLYKEIRTEVIESAAETNKSTLADLMQLSNNIESNENEIDIEAFNKMIQLIVIRPPKGLSSNLEKNMNFYEKEFFAKKDITEFLTDIKPAITTFKQLDALLVKQGHVLVVAPSGENRDIASFSLIPFTEKQVLIIRDKEIPVYTVEIAPARKVIGTRFQGLTVRWNSSAGENISNKVFPQALIFPETITKGYEPHIKSYRINGASDRQINNFIKGLSTYPSYI